MVEILDIFLALSSSVSVILSMWGYVRARKEEKELLEQRARVLNGFSQVANVYLHAIRSVNVVSSISQASYRHPLPINRIEEILVDSPKSNVASIEVEIKDYENFINASSISGMKKLNKIQNNFVEV